MSLFDDLTPQYVDQFYKGAFFALDGRVHKYIGSYGDGKFLTNSAAPGEPRFSETFVPCDAVKNMDFFAWPKLGYREIVDDKKRTHIYALSSVRSAMRGLKDDFLRFDIVAPHNLLPERYDVRDFCSQALYMQATFFPKFTDFHTGMDQLRSGKRLAFVLSEDLMVAVSTTRNTDALYDVYYRGRIIGNVDEDGGVTIPHKIAKRASSMRLFRGVLK